MSEIQADNSGSDISVDSWTLLDDKSQDENLDSRKSSDLSVEIIDMEPEVEQKPEEKQEGSEGDGFLAFDEYFQEKVLQYDYEHAERAQKKDKKRGKKLKTPPMGIFVFIAIILGLTVFATLCSTLSQTVTEKKTEELLAAGKETLPKNLKIKELNQTIKELENISLMMDIEKLRNDTCPRRMAPPKIHVSKLPPEPNSHKIFPKIHKLKPQEKSSWLAFKEFLLDTNFHAVISLVMTNIYLFNLLFDLARKPNTKKATIKQLKQKFLEDLEKSKNSAELRRYLFRELPFWNAEIMERRPNKPMQMVISAPKVIEPIKPSTTMTFLNETSLRYKSCPFLAPKSSLAVVPLMNEEAGKSECQRRFEELDHYQKKFEELRQSQRHRIRLLKQKYKNEVSHIRDTVEESEARAEKINKTSQRFIKKLKFNRERYLLELKKVKELRQRVSDAKKKESLKDVSTGSYQVALPAIYDYTEKFKMIKEKFERENQQLPKEWKF